MKEVTWGILLLGLTVVLLNCRKELLPMFPFCGKINKGKAPKDVTESLRDMKDLLAFHQNILMAMGTALQHLADSLFVHLANLILLRRDSYLEFVKPGVKPDTWNLLRNAPMFGYGLFPDSVLNTPEQDINKHKSAGVAQGPLSAPIGEVTSDINLMKGEIIRGILDHLSRINSSGDNFPGIEVEDMHMVEQTLVFPRHVASSLINDNYSVSPTKLNLSSQRLE